MSHTSHTSDAALRSSEIATPLGPMLAVGDDAALHLLEFAAPASLSQPSLAQPNLSQQCRALGAVVPGEAASLRQIRDELDAYFGGKLRRFATPCRLHGTPFQTSAWQWLSAIPFGETRTYQEQAAALGRPKGARAAGHANARNRLAILVPCHRVWGKNGAVTGYAAGTELKQKLCAHERRFL